MKRLAFITTQRKVVRFHVDGPKVIYYDEVWRAGIQIYPKDEDLVKRLIDSGKGNLKFMAAFIIDANKGPDFEEYLSCEGDEDKISEIIIRDAKTKGLILIK